jgi:hypothetical protein
MLAERWWFVTAARVVFCETSQGKNLPAVRARRATAGQTNFLCKEVLQCLTVPSVGAELPGSST